MHVGMIARPFATPRPSSSGSVRRIATRIINRLSASVAEFRSPVPVPAPAAVEPDTTEFFTEADMPAAEDIAEAARLYFRACDDARTADRAKRKAKGILSKLRNGRYGDWELVREPSGRTVADLDEIKRIFKANGLGPIPVKTSSPSLKVRRVQVDLDAEAIEQELQRLAVTR